MSNSFLELLDDGVIEIEMEMEELEDPTVVDRPRVQRARPGYDDEPTRPFACQELAWLSECTDEVSTDRWI